MPVLATSQYLTITFKSDMCSEDNTIFIICMFAMFQFLTLAFCHITTCDVSHISATVCKAIGKFRSRRNSFRKCRCRWIAKRRYTHKPRRTGHFGQYRKWTFHIFWMFLTLCMLNAFHLSVQNSVIAKNECHIGFSNMSLLSH